MRACCTAILVCFCILTLTVCALPCRSDLKAIATGKVDAAAAMHTRVDEGTDSREELRAHACCLCCSLDCSLHPRTPRKNRQSQSKHACRRLALLRRGQDGKRGLVLTLHALLPLFSCAGRSALLLPLHLLDRHRILDPTPTVEAAAAAEAIVRTRANHRERRRRLCCCVVAVSDCCPSCSLFLLCVRSCTFPTEKEEIACG